MSYQGYLADATGDPINAQLSLDFAIYGEAVGGSPVWQETHASVTILGGFFQVELGSIELLDGGLFDGPLYLGISIDGDPEIAPRTVIGSLPFARRAEGLLACAAGETNCFGVCAALASDMQNCGACGNVCLEGDSCMVGQCVEAGATQFFRDSDGDGFGVCEDFIFANEPQAPYTATICGDCDDDDPAINPGAQEICDGIDNNCDGNVDDGANCDDGNECTADFCGDGMCQHSFLDIGSTCSAGVCDGFGSCVECLTAGDCGTSSVCAIFTCQAGQCGVEFANAGTICESGGVCDGAGTCHGPTCSDGIKNGDETDVDCGGPDCGPCDSGRMCLVNSDCISGTCNAGFCD